MTTSGAADPNHSTQPTQPGLVVLRRDISAVLRSARAESGCSQREFAERCGYSQSTIARLEPYRLRAPHTWWPGVTDILMWGNEPKWSYRRYPPR